MSINDRLEKMLSSTPADTRQAVKWSGQVSDAIEKLMKERGLSKTEFARAMGKQSSEITKWLSGKHNFTLRTLSAISVYFNVPLIKVLEGGGTV